MAPSSDPPRPTQKTRRTLIVAGVGLAALVVFVTAGAYTYAALDSATYVNEGQSFERPLWIPPVLNWTSAGSTPHQTLPRPPPPSEMPPSAMDAHSLPLDIREGTHEYFSGKASDVILVNGYPMGPTIRLREGGNARMNIQNHLPEATTVHWHGMLLPPEMDGGPHQSIEPGATWTPHWRVKQEAATLWYHAHPMGATAEHVYRGLAGFLLIDDHESDALDLPREYGVDDIPLMVQDRVFEDGRLEYRVDDDLKLLVGDHITVNGVVGPHLEIPCKPVRLRLLNAANAHRFQFGFDDGRPFHVIAGDNGLLDAPVERTRILLASAERAEILVDFSDCQGARLVSHPITYPDNPFQHLLKKLTGAAFDENRRHDILDIRPIGKPSEANAPPERLIKVERPTETDAETTRRFVLGDIRTINGQRYDVDRTDFTVRPDTLEIWELESERVSHHPFHVHGVRFLILDRDGQPPEPHERGWKDTVHVDAGETVRILVRTPTYADPDTPFMYHCHMLEHEDIGMMGQFLVTTEPQDEAASARPAERNQPRQTHAAPSAASNA